MTSNRELARQARCTPARHDLITVDLSTRLEAVVMTLSGFALAGLVAAG